MNIEYKLKTLSTEELKEIINTDFEYWHEDGYWVDIKYYFTGDNIFNHIEYICKDIYDKKWRGHPDDIVGKIIHIDGIYDEYNNREDAYEDGGDEQC